MTRSWGLGAASPFLFVSMLQLPALADPPPQGSVTEPPPASAPPPAPTDSPPAAAPVEASPQAPTPQNGTPAADKPSESVPAVAAPKKLPPRLHIEADRPGVRLLQIHRVMSDDAGEGIIVSTVCTAPCDQVIHARKRQTFFFGADGMVPSRGFQLARLEGDIIARVDGGSLVARQMGFLLGGFGGVGVIGGITMLAFGNARDGTHLSSEGKVVEGPNPYLTTGGLIALGAGAAMVTTAIVLVVTQKTRFTLVRAENKSALVTLDMGTIRF